MNILGTLALLLVALTALMVFLDARAHVFAPAGLLRVLRAACLDALRRGIARLPFPRPLRVALGVGLRGTWRLADALACGVALRLSGHLGRLG